MPQRNLYVVVKRLMKFAVGIHSVVDGLRRVQGEIFLWNDLQLVAGGFRENRTEREVVDHMR